MMAPFYMFSQIGLKAGLNFANVTKASSINNSSRSGFHLGLFLAPSSKSIIGSRTELIFSRCKSEYQFKQAIRFQFLYFRRVTILYTKSGCKK